MFYFNRRFIKYVYSLIKYSSVDFHRRNKVLQSRNLLIFDVPYLDSEISLGDHLYITNNIEVVEENQYFNCDDFRSSLENEHLFLAISCLTPRQMKIITLYYSGGLLDKDIARKLHVSQQAVTKVRLAALKKLKKYLLDISF